MNKFLVLTTINSPSKAIKEYTGKKDWNIVVVGDKKTPKSWKYKGVHYLSIEDQNKLFPKLSKLIPLNSYSRKNIGYLYAIKNGAEIIADGDDDNIPTENWGKIPDQKDRWTVSGNDFINIYNFFTNEKVWPRGFPLDKINTVGDFEFSVGDEEVGVWQFMVNKDPDVDAIYRLVNDKDIFFNKRASVFFGKAKVGQNGIRFKKDNVTNTVGSLVLGKGVLCPTNSQNTLFLKKAFPTLYLPSFVNFRATDIYRGYISQTLLWNSNLHTGFSGPTAVQERNVHDLMDDFESELPVYKFSSQISEIAQKAISSDLPLKENLLKSYRSLVKMRVLQDEELLGLEAWLAAVSNNS